MAFLLQPVLQDSLILARPLEENDFEALYEVASDPLVWEQHPNRDRYKREVFQNYFKGAIESGGAFLVLHTQTGEVIGCSRFYDLDEANSTIAIGYTFIGRDFWGGGYNKELKRLMLEHAFNFVDRVVFHIGASNIRSQKAIEKLGGKKVKELKVAYYGEPEKLNFEYEMLRNDWPRLKAEYF